MQLQSPQGSEVTGHDLAEDFYLDYNHPAVQEFAARYSRAHDRRERVLELYLAVRDRIRYNPYVKRLDAGAFKISTIIESGEGFCVQKALVLAGLMRLVGVAGRVGFADVRNHMSTARLRDIMQTDIFYWHGYTDIHFNGRWVKATPAFDRVICRAFKVKPLVFDGSADSIFQEHNGSGDRYMEYLHDYGSFSEFPYETMKEVYARRYPGFVNLYSESGKLKVEGDFTREAADEV